MRDFSAVLVTAIAFVSADFLTAFAEAFSVAFFDAFCIALTFCAFPVLMVLLACFGGFFTGGFGVHYLVPA